jgi:hypothetical protein
MIQFGHLRHSDQFIVTSRKLQKKKLKKIIKMWVFSRFYRGSRICFVDFPNFRYEMGCPTLGVLVAFLKQPTLPGEALQSKKNSKKILKKF